MGYSEITTTINRSFLLPAYLLWNGDARLKRLKEMEKFQWLSRDEIEAKQFADVRDMVSFAYHNVPYYRERFEALQVSPDDVKSFDDMKKLPILSKKDLQENSSRMVSNLHQSSQIYQDASGGSTGQPTIFFGDKTMLYKRYAAVLMTDKWTGWEVGEKSAYLWGADREVNIVKSLKHRFVEKHIFRQDFLNAFSVTEDEMYRFSQMIMKEKPSIIIAYSNAAYQFALFLRRQGLPVASPKGIVCSAETLSDEKRKVIEEVFQCKVLNRYGSREVGLIASECPCQEGLHINAADIFVELKSVPSTGGAQRMGEVVVTDLTNRVMPLIRYNMGDLALFRDNTCSCGRGLPVIGNVTGRSSDFIIGPGGRLIHGEYFSHAFYGVAGIRQFQIVQHTLNTIDINVVAMNNLSADEKRRLALPLEEFMGSEVKITIHAVDSIPVPLSGKFRFAISHVFDSLSHSSVRHESMER